MIKFKNILKEIGDASFAYPYVFDNLIAIDVGSFDSVRGEFVTDSGLEYYVECKEIGGYLEVDFNAFDNHKPNNLSDYEMTNRGELFKVMGTITKIVKEVLSVSPDIKGIRFNAASTKLKDSSPLGSEQRIKLYKAFIETQGMPVEYTQTRWGTTFATFVKPLQENIDLPINVGDTILGGKFLNRKIKVKKIGKNKKDDFTINGKPLLRFRIPKNKIEESAQATKSFDKQKIINLCKRLENKCRKEIDLAWPIDCCFDTCMFVSDDLKKELPNLDFTVITGYIKLGREEPEHTWIETEKYIIDPTAGQFFDGDVCRFFKKGGLTAKLYHRRNDSI